MCGSATNPPPQEMDMHEPSDKATRIASIRRTRARAGHQPGVVLVATCDMYRFPAIPPRNSELAVCHAEMSAVRTIVVGCGEPKKSMGWFHLQQLSVNPKAELLAVVEPW